MARQVMRQKVEAVERDRPDWKRSGREAPFQTGQDRFHPDRSQHELALVHLEAKRNATGSRGRSDLIASLVHTATARWGSGNTVCAGLLCLAALAGCTTPQVSVTDAAPDGIRFLVRDALLVPWGSVDEQAASHCRNYDMTWRRSGSERSAPGSLIVSYDCVATADMRRAEVRRVPSRQPSLAEKTAQSDVRTGQADASAAQDGRTGRTTAVIESVQTPPGAETPPAQGAQADSQPAPADSKAAAWQKAKAATDAWAQCLQHGAERKAQEGNDAPQAAAQAVLDGCATLERAVHEPLRAAGEETPGFQTDLHAQAIQRVSQTIVQTRLNGKRQDAAAERVGAVEAARR